jgi:hypothetical protein
VTADRGAHAGPVTRMEPTRDLGATLPDLLDVLLDQGVYLDLDLIITVADIPLVGVSLQATIAGIETMLEHGLMREWDEETRRWARRSVSRHVPLADDERIVLRMAGGHLRTEPYRSWRPGIVYLTSRRLVVWRADPGEILWQSPLADVAAVDLRPGSDPDGPERTRVVVAVPGGQVLLAAAAPQRLHDAVREAVRAREGAGDGDR